MNSVTQSTTGGAVYHSAMLITEIAGFGVDLTKIGIVTIPTSSHPHINVTWL